MNGPVKISVSRAPALIPGLVDAVRKARLPLILVPESFTLTTEQALVQAAPEKGFIGTQVFSTRSLIREIRERAGFPDKAVISADGRHMLLSLLLLKNKDRLLFYKENANQISMAEKLAGQIDDLTDGGFDSKDLLVASQKLKKSTRYKCHDIALLWEEYRKVLDSGFLDQNTEWETALGRLQASGLFKDRDLLIYGFDYINMNLTRLVAKACPLVRSITIGLVSETGCPDDHIFEVASNSVRRFVRRMGKEEPRIPVVIEPFRPKGDGADPGIRFLEQNLYAMGKSAQEPPDLSAVQVYYAANTTVECLYTAQTLIRWHREGIAWHDMAVAVCDETTIPSMLPLVLASAGVPFAQRGGDSMLLSEYARFFLAALRSLRTGYRQEEVLKLIKSRFTGLTEEEIMDLENYAHEHGIDRGRWQKPFRGDDPETARLEELRKRIMEPLAALRKKLTARTCSGRQAAGAIFDHMLASGAYDILLKREKELIDAGELAGADRNRQVWSAVNDLLDQLAVFAPKDHLSLEKLCLMLESAICAKTIKSLPQLADSVIVSSPNMFFSSGVRAVALVGMQDMPAAPPAALLTPAECAGLVRIDEKGETSSGIGRTRREAAARARQDIYQAAAAARERILFSCSAAQPNGRVLSPSRAFRDVEELIKKHKPENLHGGLMEDELVPFVPQFALERLAVMLRQARDLPDSFLTKEDPESLLWQGALAFLWQDPDWHEKMSAVLEGLHVTIAGPGIPAELAGLLYGLSRLSVSAIETAGTCMYWAFLAYGLRVRERRDFVFEADSRGTFTHEVLRLFFNEAMKQPDWPVLSDDQVLVLLDRVLGEQTKAWEDGPLEKNACGRFQGEEILRTVRTAVRTMARAIRDIPHFKPVGMEVGFGRMSSDSSLHFPAVILKLEDGREVALSGKIDRVDTLDLSDGEKAFLIFDFKSGDKDVHEEALKAGVQIQLPIYLAAAREGLPGYIPAGALYQPVKEVLVDADDDDKDAIEEGIEKALRSRGLYLDDEEILRASAPIRLQTRAASSDVVSCLTLEGLQELIEKGKAAASAVVSRMLSGETAPAPLQSGMRSPCEYCGKKQACPLDSRLPGGQVKKLGSVKEED